MSEINILAVANAARAIEFDDVARFGIELWLLLSFLACAVAAVVYHRRCKREWHAQLGAERQACTKAIQAERENASQAHEQQRALLESMAEGVLVLDRQGRITMANHLLRELLQTKSEIKGKTVEEAFRIPTLVAMAAQLPEQRLLPSAELQMPGHGFQVVEINASAMIDADGVYNGAVFVFHDLSRLKQLENTRRDFVANVSHELRTPLSLIKGFVETLLDAGSHDPIQAERFLQTILKHVNRLTCLIEDLLTISCLETGPASLSLQPLQLRHLAQRVIDDLASKAEKRNTRLENQVPSDVTLQADPDRLQQVLFNLVENAIKYGCESGRVIVQGALTPKNEVIVSVADNGPGIPREAQGRVFERFYRADRARSRETGGTGLGLAIVKHIVQAHGGTVSLRSEPGCGATFSAVLPRACPPGHTVATEKPTAGAEAPAKRGVGAVGEN